MANNYTLSSFGIELPKPAGDFLLIAALVWDGRPLSASEMILGLGAEEREIIATAVGEKVSDPDSIIAAIEKIVDEIENGKERMPLGIELQWDEHSPTPRIWGHSDESFYIENTVALIQEAMSRFGVAGVHTIRWASTCSKPALDEFGGGAVVFNATDATWITLDPAIEAAEKALAPKPGALAPGL